MIAIGIALAVCSALLLSVGAQLQHHGVRQVSDGTTGFQLWQFLPLLRQPRWVVGGFILALSALLHLTSLGLAPVIVVQPIGIIGLVATAIFTRAMTHTHFTRVAVIGVLACVIGITAFVGCAALIARDPQITSGRVGIVLGVLAATIALVLSITWLRRDHLTPLTLIIAGGALHGYNAILLKSILFRAQHGLLFSWLTALCLLGLILSFSLGTYYVQRAYAITQPDVVLAGMTVVDPLVAVVVGAIVLGEAAHAPAWMLLIFLASGLAACLGVNLLTRDAQRVHLDKKVDLTT